MIKTDFKKDSEEKISFFEKLCIFSERIIKVSPDKKTATKLYSAIDFCDMKITPTQVMSFAILFLLCGLAITTVMLLLGVQILYVIIIFIISFLGMLYILNYPYYLSQVLRVKASSELVLSVVYMVISMRTIPNLENAIKFVAKNLSGPLARDFEKVLWFTEIGKYYTVEEGLSWLAKKWKEENEEFVESINLLISSTQVTGEKRDAILKEAVDLMLTGTKERLTHYSQSLRTPIYLLHAMGILLPLMGLVMFPIVAIFLSEVIRPVVLFIGYDVILPITLFYFIEHAMGKRPITFALPDISGHPDVPPKGKFLIDLKKKIALPAWPFALLVSLPFIVLGILLYGSSENIFMNTIYSLSFVWAITLGISVYFILITFQSMSIREDIKKIESELPEVLFQLGNQFSVGIPVERAVENSLIHFKNLRIGDLFSRTIENMKKLGMSFDSALFDKNIGSLRFYPSKLLTLIMKTIVESVKKSAKTASEIVKIISDHLKSMHAVEETIKDILGEVVASINFQSMFLAPLVAGITVTMAVVMIYILTAIIGKVGVVEAPILSFWKNIPITAEQFQLIVGIYMIESCIILAYSANKIEYGIDEIGRNYSIGITLLIATAVYTISLVITVLIFGPTIARLVV